MRTSYGRIQRIISDIIEQRKEMRAAVSSNDEEDLLDVLLRLHMEDSLPYPLTLEAIGVIIFVSIVTNTFYLFLFVSDKEDKPRE